MFSLAVCGASSAQASTIFLAGSEAASFHQIAAYTNPVFKQLQGTSTLPVLAINDFGAGPGYYSDTGGVAVKYVSAAGFSAETLSDYSALFFASPGTCCSDPAALLGIRGGDVATYVAGGGSLYIEDYQGLAAWDPIIGIPGAAAGVTSSMGCQDPGVSTPAGLAFGFAPSYTLSCFLHQTYDPAFWTAKGYFALQTNGNTGSATFGDFVTMATGFVEPGTVPEPTTLALLGIGIASLLSSRRTQRNAR